MEEDQVQDDASHYEVSLTAGQAFIAFVLLLLSLAASFAFGVVIGRGQIDERLAVRRDPAIVTEGEVTDTDREASKLVDLGVEPGEVPTLTETAEETTTVVESVPIDPDTTPVETSTSRPLTETQATTTVIESSPAPVPVPVPAATGTGSYVAQLLSSSEAKVAEALAARLIDNGFSTAFVDRQQTPKGTLYRVRVRFSSEKDARAALDRLKPYSREEIWITKE